MQVIGATAVIIFASFISLCFAKAGEKIRHSNIARTVHEISIWK